MAEDKVHGESELELEYIGGSSRFKGKHIVIQRGNEMDSLKVEGQSYKLKKFHWIEQGTHNLGMAVIGFGIGSLIGYAAGQDLILGIIGGVIGAALLGSKHDNSMVILTLVDNQSEIQVYVRCTKAEFRALSELIQ